MRLLFLVPLETKSKLNGLSGYKRRTKMLRRYIFRIRVLFSISDINNGSNDDFLPEDDMVEAETEEEESVSFPVRASVTIEKVIVFT